MLNKVIDQLVLKYKRNKVVEQNDKQFLAQQEIQNKNNVLIKNPINQIEQQDEQILKQHPQSNIQEKLVKPIENQDVLLKQNEYQKPKLNSQELFYHNQLK
ncbi:hypothetical protein TTHERM_00554560 (macronuclear) [Tetrahymena thermophila SB210]|uniref:Uncharacterized protein n=1 Tax=Tetrahymena thermophila (strain SB210) TaxID=312017 RepID=Q22UG9_TETTS|nr:hypothetical protein TTHERM_00554560 [Tetrahymena thermophila SB210]EAR89001.1 hypothetical protein TTHERM_00554560 [Tetrahymena thermophila SB210]|eukprot:XP_001009246.1 hypothetical protein TTHERM_00554560 [Tetrahymena thermophila SB210]